MKMKPSSEKPAVKVLLIDDEESQYHHTRELLSDVRETYHYELKWVMDFEAALDLLQEEPMDVILLDYNLGSVDGISLLKSLRRKGIRAPVIFVTGVRGYSVDMEAMRAGATDYLNKGEFDGVKLERTIRYALERHKATEQVKYRTENYSWVGLPNRSWVERHLSGVIAQGRRRKKADYAILLLDVNKFGRINDTYGHVVGDQLLHQIAERLKICVRNEDRLGHMGGNQFILLAQSLTDFRGVLLISNRIQAEFEHPFLIGSDEIYLTVRTGIVLASPSYEKPHEMLRDAARACEEVKSQTTMRHVVYSQRLGNKATHLFKLESDLRKAISLNEFTIYYQPIVSVSENAFAGYEALIRWNHPSKGFLSPAEFIPLAEETGLIIPMGEWVLRKALVQAKKWERQGFHHLRLAVNFSARQFHDLNLAESVEKLLGETGVPPQCLELEITETAAMGNLEKTLSNLRQLKKIGVMISIDDFGTGYSSLSSLKRFPIHTLKIDKSFIEEMLNDGETRSIVKTILSMAQYLNLRTIAEGVENELQLEMLRELGCHEYQGYLFSKPLSAEELGERLERDNRVS